MNACFLSASISTPYGAHVEAVIFDCDGVLVDTEYLKFLAWKESLADFNTPFTIEEYMPLVGHSSENILFMLRKLKNTEIPAEVIS
jgi:beta-phosphoglucomutase